MLKDFPAERITRGTVISFPARSPLEATIEAMLVNWPPPQGIALMIETGASAGSVLCTLPQMACSPGASVEAKWLVESWTSHIYGDCTPESVLIHGQRNPPFHRSFQLRARRFYCQSAKQREPSKSSIPWINWWRIKNHGQSRLVDHSTDVLTPGCVLRFPADTPYERSVDFMLAAWPNEGYVLVVDSGRKAGLIALILPTESFAHNAGVTGISADWMSKNWNRWVWKYCRAQDVYLIPRREARIDRTVPCHGRRRRRRRHRRR